LLVKVPWSLPFGRYDVVVKSLSGRMAVRKKGFKWVGPVIHAAEPRYLSLYEGQEARLTIHGYGFYPNKKPGDDPKGLEISLGKGYLLSSTGATVEDFDTITVPMQEVVALLLDGKQDKLPLDKWLDLSVSVQGDQAGVAVLKQAIGFSKKKVVAVSPNPVCATGIRELEVSGCGLAGFPVFLRPLWSAQDEPAVFTVPNVASGTLVDLSTMQEAGESPEYDAPLIKVAHVLKTPMGQTMPMGHALAVYPGEGIELFDLGTREFSSIGDGFLYWVRKTLEAQDGQAHPYLAAPLSRLGEPKSWVYFQSTEIFGETETPTRVRSRCLLVVSRGQEGQLLRVGAVGLACGDPEKRESPPAFTLRTRWERPICGSKCGFCRWVEIGAKTTYLPFRKPGLHSIEVGFQQPVVTRVEITVECCGTWAPKLTWSWVQPPSQTLHTLDPAALAAADWVFGGKGIPLFRVVQMSPPTSLDGSETSWPENEAGPMPRFEGKLVLEGPADSVEADGAILCTVTSETGDYKATTLPVHVKLRSHLKVDANLPMMVSEKAEQSIKEMSFPADAFVPD